MIEEMNEDFHKPFTKTEIEKAIFQMGPLKSLDPDGFGTIFYQF